MVHSRFVCLLVALAVLAPSTACKRLHGADRSASDADGGAVDGEGAGGMTTTTTATLPAGAKAPALPPVGLSDPVPFTLGGKVVKGEVCRLDAAAPEMMHESFGAAISGIAVAADGAVFVLASGQLRKYRPPRTVGPCELVLDRSYAKEGILALPAALRKSDRVEQLSMDANGSLYFSGMGFPLFRVDGATVTRVCDDSSAGRVGASGRVAYGSSTYDLTKPDCSFTSWKSPDWNQDALGSPSLAPYGDGFSVHGRSQKGSDGFYRVALFSRDGARRALVGTKEGPERMCNVGPVAKGTRGALVVDANCRSLKAWSETGAFQGEAALEKLTGVSYPWVVDLAVRDGVGYMAMTSDRKPSAPSGKRESIGLVARLTGL